MSLLSMIIANPLDGEQKPWKPWYGYLLIGVLLVSGGLYVYQRMHGGPTVPTFTDPATVYENAKAARERQEEGASDEALGASTEVALSEVAKEALEFLSVPLPTSADIAVPFLTQAPSGVWDDAHINASEEASLLMVRGALSPDASIDTVDGMIALQEAGDGASQFDAVEFAAYIEAHDATLNATVIEDPTLEEMKTHLSEGTPILVLVDGNLLENPFYIAEGLPHHWIVLRGYDATSFVTNDPGTRRGEQYMYAQSVVMAAMKEHRVVIVEKK